jgi:hypothetical protein
MPRLQRVDVWRACGASKTYTLEDEWFDTTSGVCEAERGGGFRCVAAALAYHDGGFARG